MSLLGREAVKRVRGALVYAGLEDTVIELTDTARSAKDAAKANEVKAITRFTISGVAPIGMTACLPMAIASVSTLPTPRRATRAASFPSPLPIYN